MTLFRNMSRAVSLVALMSASTLTLVGCATLGGGTPEQAVSKRAEAYWRARMAGQVDKAYALSTPSYRKLRSEAQFKLQFGAGASVESAEVVGVACEAEKCTAKVKLGVKPALMGLKVGTIATHVDETWLLEDGQWWRYQEL